MTEKSGTKGIRAKTNKIGNGFPKESSVTEQKI